MYISDEEIPRDDLLDYTPLIRNPAGNIINQFFEWRTISGQYQARGGEKHLVIGNFLDNDHTTLQPNTLRDSLQNSTYYFIDAVVVEPCKSRFPTQEFIMSSDTAFCQGEEVSLTVNPLLQDYPYTWSNGATNAV